MSSPSRIGKKLTHMTLDKRKIDMMKYKSKSIYDHHMKKHGRIFQLEHSVLFPDSLETNGNEWFDANIISHEHILRHIFAESCWNI